MNWEEKCEEFHLFDLEKGLFPSHHPSKLSKEFEICHVDIVGAIHVLCKGFDFSDPLYLFTVQKCGFLVGFSYFLSSFLA